MKFVQEAETLVALGRRLRGAALIGADTEAAGFHRYHDRICLLQVSTREETYVIDTLALARPGGEAATGAAALDGIGAVLGDAETEVIFHDADYDVRLLHRDFGIAVGGLFDTKIAAQFLGEPAIGLASLLEKYVGIVLEKKYQRADWARRPLPPEMLAYAAKDTEHLPPLRDALRAELEARGRLAWAEEEFRLIEALRWEPTEQPDEAYLRMKGTRDFTPRQLAALRELYDWREEEARERDAAPFRVVLNEVLLSVARTLPASREALQDEAGISSGLARRWGGDLLDGVSRALRVPEAELPRRPRRGARPPRDPELDAIVDRLRAARDGGARELGLDRGFLMPRSQLEEIGRARPASRTALEAVASVRRWQVDALGDRLLAALQSTRTGSAGA